MKTWRRWISGLLGLALLASLAVPALAAGAAMKTEQFLQWFPEPEADLPSPEALDEVLSHMGTVLRRGKTVGGATVTLNGALWDGDTVRLSLTLTSPDIPEEVGPFTRLYTEECSLKLPEAQWRAYIREQTKQDCAGMDWTEERLEEEIQSRLDRGQQNYDVSFRLFRREGNTLTFELTEPLTALAGKPALTLHLANIATCKEGMGDFVSWTGDKSAADVFLLKGSADFTFTLENLVPPVRCTGGGVNVTIGKVPLRFTELRLSATELQAAGEVLAPVDHPLPGEQPDPDKLSHQDLALAQIEGPWGLWTKDGTYVDLTDMGGGMSGGGSGEALQVTMSHEYPYPMDPASVAAVNIGGVRVELETLTPVTE